MPRHTWRVPVSSVSITEDGTGVVLSVYVTPRAGRSEIAGEREGALWVRLAAPPVDGRANQALVTLLAQRLGVAKGQVELMAGETGRRKRVRVAHTTAAALRARLSELVTAPDRRVAT